MNNYHIINDLPCRLDFENRTRKELNAFKKWFVDNESRRLCELENCVRHSNFPNLKLDFSPDSLIGLGDFMAEAIKTEPLSKEEYEEKRAKIPVYIEIEDWELTLESRSLVIDLGMYWGEVMIRNHPGLSWNQYISRNKKDVDFGYMVIQLNKNICVNPIWLIYIQALKVADDTFERDGLFKLYETWNEKIR